jgi:hypothetical protein
MFLKKSHILCKRRRKNMVFQRNHAGDFVRLLIGLGVYLHKGIYGYVSGKATEYGVSRPRLLIGSKLCTTGLE